MRNVWYSNLHSKANKLIIILCTMWIPEVQPLISIFMDFSDEIGVNDRVYPVSCATEGLAVGQSAFIKIENGTVVQVIPNGNRTRWRYVIQWYPGILLVRERAQKGRPGK